MNPFRRRWRWAAATLAAGLAAIGWYAGGDQPAPARPAAAAARPAAAGLSFFSGVDSAPMPAPQSGRAARLRELDQAFRLADSTYCSYRNGTRYPPGSRPIAENTDQVYPNQPVTETNPMRVDRSGSDPAVLLQTSQSRVYLGSGEGVAFSLRAVDVDGRVLPLVVTRAVAQGISFGNTRATPQVALAFADDGMGADPVADDGAFAATLVPAQTGLAGFHGTIRTEVRYSAGGRAGTVWFDVIYSPVLPATWTGQIREALEDGSLNLYLKADVRVAGRYIVTARADDATGRPFALLTFNDLLATGPNEVRLTVFGKLMRDQDLALPLSLRDVDGYLLKENTDPDRALMPRLEGQVYVSKGYPLRRFSDAEWQSAQRTRYLSEFGKDLRLARGDLSAFDPSLPMPGGECPALAP